MVKKDTQAQASLAVLPVLFNKSQPLRGPDDPAIDRCIELAGEIGRRFAEATHGTSKRSK